MWSLRRIRCRSCRLRGRSGHAGQSLRTPKWRFKGRPSAGAAAETTPLVSAPEPISASVVSPPNARPISGFAADGLGRSSAVHLDFDRARKEITFRLRYTTALVSVFGVCALVGLAYVIGRHMSRGPQTISAVTVPQSAPQYIRLAPQAGVTNVIRQRLPRPMIDPATPSGRNAEAANPVPRVPASLVPAGAEVRLPRAIGLNYAIVQTYPPEEIESAKAACDFLTRNGIPCTIEKTDFVHKPDWVCLVGTAGFAKISSGDFKTYVDNIISLGEKFPTSHFDRFRPAAYKWKGS